MPSSDKIIVLQVVAGLAVVLFGIGFGLTNGYVRSRFRFLGFTAIAVLISTIIGGYFYVTSAAKRLNVTLVRQDPEASIRTLSALLVLEPSYAKALTLRGVANVKLGRVNDARADLEQALRAEPHDEIASIELGKIASTEGESKRALELLDGAILRNPRDFDALTARGITEIGITDLDAAVRDFGRSLEVSQDVEDRFVAHANLGLAFALRQQPEAAINEFREALRLQPNNAQMMAQLANSYGKAGHHQQALDFSLMALAIDPKNVVARSTQAGGLFYLGDRDRGLELASDLVRDYPDDPSFLLARARLYTQSNQPQKASDDIQRAQTLIESRRRTQSPTADFLYAS